MPKGVQTAGAVPNPGIEKKKEEGKHGIENQSTEGSEIHLNEVTESISSIVIDPDEDATIDEEDNQELPSDYDEIHEIDEDFPTFNVSNRYIEWNGESEDWIENHAIEVGSDIEFEEGMEKEVTTGHEENEETKPAVTETPIVKPIKKEPQPFFHDLDHVSTSKTDMEWDDDESDDATRVGSDAQFYFNDMGSEMQYEMDEMTESGTMIDHGEEEEEDSIESGELHEEESQAEYDEQETGQDTESMMKLLAQVRISKKKKAFEAEEHKFKQDKLIATYMSVILKLKAVRKKNLYFQDRIYRHLRDNEKVVKDCHEAVRVRQEKKEDKRLSLSAADHTYKLSFPQTVPSTNSEKFFDNDGEDVKTDDEELPEKQVQRKRQCHNKLKQRKSVANLRNQKMMEAMEAIQQTQILTEAEVETNIQDDELVLPEFNYELSDVSLTKMKHGQKLRQDMERVLKRSKLQIKLQWPLSVRGFHEYFEKTNSYGKVIYTMRPDNQIKQAKKITKKYKYILHNYNYHIQQNNVLDKVHTNNLEYLEKSRLKWDGLVDDLFLRVLDEIREYSEVAIDTTGKRLSREQIDRSCREIVKEFQAFQYKVKVFYRVLFNVDITLRHLCKSESHGQGVELYEFKHLLRSNETIGAQYAHRREMLRDYKKTCRRFVGNYKNLIDLKHLIEADVTDKFKVSGELSCELAPKQETVKRYERLKKRVMKQEEILRAHAGILPFRNLVIDYENTFMTIAEKRQERRDLQLAFNKKLRNIRRRKVRANTK